MSYKDLFEDNFVHLKFNLGSVVYLKTDKEQCPRIVTGIIIRPIGVAYYLSCGSTESTHYDFEMTSEVDVIIKTDN